MGIVLFRNTRKASVFTGVISWIQLNKIHLMKLHSTRVLFRILVQYAVLKSNVVLTAAASLWLGSLSSRLSYIVYRYSRVDLTLPSAALPCPPLPCFGISRAARIAALSSMGAGPKGLSRKHILPLYSDFTNLWTDKRKNVQSDSVHWFFYSLHFFT